MTKCTQAVQYIRLHSGHDYLIYSKYSYLLTTVFITMTYGVGIPILFPIAAFTFALFWLHERYYIAYRYRLSPSFDDKLSKNAIDILRWTPMLLLFNGYWMLSNR